MFALVTCFVDSHDGLGVTDTYQLYKVKHILSAYF